MQNKALGSHHTYITLIKYIFELQNSVYKSESSQENRKQTRYFRVSISYRKLYCWESCKVTKGGVGNPEISRTESVGHSVVSGSLQPPESQRGIPMDRLLCPWDYPGKNTWVGCHSFLQEDRKKIGGETKKRTQHYPSSGLYFLLCPWEC